VVDAYIMVLDLLADWFLHNYVALVLFDTLL